MATNYSKRFSVLAHLMSTLISDCTSYLPSCHPFKLAVRINLGIDPESGLSAAERDVNASALVRHEGGQGFDLVSADVQGVTDTSFARRAMVGVLLELGLLYTSIFNLT